MSLDLDGYEVVALSRGFVWAVLWRYGVRTGWADTEYQATRIAQAAAKELALPKDHPGPGSEYT